MRPEPEATWWGLFEPILVLCVLIAVGVFLHSLCKRLYKYVTGKVIDWDQNQWWLAWHPKAEEALANQTKAIMRARYDALFMFNIEQHEIRMSRLRQTDWSKDPPPLPAVVTDRGA